MSENPSSIESLSSLNDPRDLVQMPFFFEPDWPAGLVVQRAFNTLTRTTEAGVSVRTSLRNRPLRSYTGRLIGSTSEQSSALRTLSRAAVASRILMPALCEYAEVDGPVSAGENVLALVDIKARSLRQGVRVFVLYESPDKLVQKPSDFQVTTIAAVSGSQITLANNTTRASNYCRIYPAIEREMTLSQIGGVAETDHVTTMAFEVSEYPGNQSLAAFRDPGLNPSGFEVYDGLPVLTARIDYGRNISWGFSREGSISSSIAQVVGRPLYRESLPITMLSREEIQDLWTFFDSRGGRAFPFLHVSSFDCFYSPTGLTASGILTAKIQGGVEASDWSEYIRIRHRDGRSWISKITSIAAAGESVAITLTDPPGEAISGPDLESIRFAHRCFFESDTLTTEFFSDRAATAVVEVKESPGESEVSISDLTAADSSDLANAFLFGNCSGETDEGDGGLPFPSPPGLVVSLRDYINFLDPPSDRTRTGTGSLSEYPFGIFSGPGASGNGRFYPDPDNHPDFFLQELVVQDDQDFVIERITIVLNNGQRSYWFDPNSIFIGYYAGSLQEVEDAHSIAGLLVRWRINCDYYGDGPGFPNSWLRFGSQASCDFPDEYNFNLTFTGNGFEATATAKGFTGVDFGYTLSIGGS